MSVTGIQLRPQNPSAGEETDFVVKITNTGGETADTIESEVRVDGSLAGVPPTTQVAPGETVSVPASAGYEFSGGTHTVVAAVDPDNHISESDEGNNEESTSVDIEAQYGSISGRVTDDQGAPVNGAKVYLDATTDTRTNDNGEYEFTQVPEDEYTLEVRTSKYEASSATAQVTAGETTTQNFEIARQLPDLRVTSLKLEPSSPKPGDTVDFRIVIKNAGTVPADTIESEIRVDGSLAGVPPTTQVAPGETVSVPASAGYEFATGTHTVTAIVDPDDKISERNENNNRAQETYEVAGESEKAAFIQTERDVIPPLPTGSFEGGEGLTAATTVKNTGTVGETFYVGYTASHKQSDRSYDVPERSVTLAPGETTDVALTWTVPNGAPTGKYQLDLALWRKSTDDGLTGNLDRVTGTVTVTPTKGAPTIVGYDPQDETFDNRTPARSEEKFEWADASVPAGQSSQTLDIRDIPNSPTRITSTEKYPWSAVGDLSSSLRRYGSICSGVIIEDNHVLTAAHCVVDEKNNTFKQNTNNLEFSPGFDAGNTLYRGSVEYIQLYKNYLSYDSSLADPTPALDSYDIAVLTLDREIGSQTGKFGYTASPAKSDRYSDTAHATGYPAKSNSNYVPVKGAQMEIPVTGQGTNFIGITTCRFNDKCHKVNARISGGLSGGPVWQTDATGDPQVISVVSSGGITGVATRISQNKSADIGQMVEFGDQIELPPTGRLSVSRPTVSVGQRFTLDASESRDPDQGNIQSYEWYFDNSPRIPSSSPTTITQSPKIRHAFDDPGTHTVWVKVIDDEARTEIERVTVNVSRGEDLATLVDDKTGLPSGKFSPGDDVTATVTVESTGTAEETFHVGYTLTHQDSGTAYDVSPKDVTLAPGATQEVTLTWTVPESPQTGEFGVTTAVWLESTDEGLTGRQDDATGTVSVAPDAPIADAGNDRTVTAGETVTFDATESSSPNGDALTYQFQQVPQGDIGPAPDVSLQDSGTRTPEFTAPEIDSETTLTFKLTVTDSARTTDTDRVNITVKPVNKPTPPDEHHYEFIEADVTWQEAREAASERTHNGRQGYLVTITSKQEQEQVQSLTTQSAWIGASDAAEEGTWRWVTGPEGKENDGKGRHFFTQSGSGGTAVNGQYTNWYSPTDEPNNADGEDYADLFDRVNANAWNDADRTKEFGYIVEYGGTQQGQPPEADAGEDQTIAAGKTVKLDATGSSSPNDDALTYQFQQVSQTDTETGSAPDVSLQDSDTRTPEFTAPNVDSKTTLRFELTVTEAESTEPIDTDRVNITVQPVASSIGATRSVSTTEVTNGSTVTVAVEVSFEGPTDDAKLVDRIDGEAIDAEDLTITDAAGAAFPVVTSEPTPTVDVTWNETLGTVSEDTSSTVEYELTIPEETPVGTTIRFDGTVTNSNSGETVVTGGETQLTVIADATSTPDTVTVGGQTVPTEFTKETSSGDRTVTADNAVEAINTFISGDISADIAVDVINAFIGV